MKLNAKTMTKIWKESISTFVILVTILTMSGHFESVQPIVVTASEAIVLDSGELPSQENPLAEYEKLADDPNWDNIYIEELIADVESGKAGKGDARKEYLGVYYEAVQTIINERYKTRSVVSSRGGDYTRATSGSKAEYQSYAYDLVIAKGWSESDFQILINLWERESGWDPNSHNSSSGAHGIPQSLPASKMSSHGEDYYTNGYTQIRWGLDYISNRYGSPSSAWSHFQNKGWY